MRVSFLSVAISIFHVLYSRSIIPHMAFCFLSLASNILNPYVRSSPFSMMLMNGGISRLIFPNGPSTSILLLGSERLMARVCLTSAESKIRNLTSGGSERGARPILDWYWEDVEKGAWVLGRAKAGTRKAGRVMSLVREDAVSLRRGLAVRRHCFVVAMVGAMEA
jgi:hypothetical protein